MLVSSLTLFTYLVSVASALPGLQRRQEVVWTTVEVVTTVDQVVATAYKTIQATAPTQVAIFGSVEQEQVIVNEVTVEYTYSSARTVFVVPTVVSSVYTTTATVTVYVSNGATVTPEPTATITNSINAQQTPLGTAVGVPVTATLPLVSVLIDGATVTVSAQTYTYYTPVVDNAGVTIAASTTMSAAPTAVAVSSVSKILGGSAALDTSDGNGVAMTASASSSSKKDSEPSLGASTSKVQVQLASTRQNHESSVTAFTSSASLSPSSVSGIAASSTAPAFFSTATSLTSPLSSSTSSSAATSSTGATITTSAGIAESTQDAFVTSVLTSMNAYRALHSAPALVWNYTLASASLEYAESCVMSHSDGSGYGETLAAGTSTDPTFYISLWYNEGSNYNYNQPGFSEATGHFTQLVWVATTSVGCGFSSGCGQYPDYLVCRYSPAGNVVGGTNNDEYFIENVLES